MRYILIFVFLALITGCTKKSYYGFVYDYNTNEPIPDVEISDYLNNTKTFTNAEGYFLLKHEGHTSGQLIFKKAGYPTDTFPTVSHPTGERTVEAFKGDTVFRFALNSKFKDSIDNLNKFPPGQ